MADPEGVARWRKLAAEHLAAGDLKHYDLAERAADEIERYGQISPTLYRTMMRDTFEWAIDQVSPGLRAEITDYLDKLDREN